MSSSCWFSPPNNINTYSLVYKSNFPVTFSLVKTFREMSVKWLLFNFFVPQKVPMRTSVIIKSTPKFFIASSVLFMAGFTSKKVNYILRSAIQILRSNGIYMRFVDDDSNWCVLVICLQISHLGLLHGPQKPYSVLRGGTLTLTRMSFKLFPFFKTYYWNILKNFTVFPIRF